jgi:hypothetical protein
LADSGEPLRTVAIDCNHLPGASRTHHAIAVFGYSFVIVGSNSSRGSAPSCVAISYKTITVGFRRPFSIPEM